MINLQEALSHLQKKLQSWMEGFILILPNLFIAALILVVTHFISKILQRLVKNVLRRFVRNQALIDFLGIFARVTAFIFGLVIAIRILRLDDAVFSILAGVGIVGLAIGFAFQDVASNFIAGIALVFRSDRPFKVGDIVETNEYIGTIDEINLRDTLLTTFEGQSVFIPNKLIFENAVLNYSLLGRRRVDLAVGVSYGEDLEKVKRVTIDAVKSIHSRIQEKGIELFFEEFGDSSINFQVRFWILFVKQIDFLQARSLAVMKIHKAYNENDIVIPFPIRTLDFGIKGGRTISDMIVNTRNIHGMSEK